MLVSLFPTPHAHASETTFTGETIDGWISYAKPAAYPPDTTGTPTVDTNDAFGRVGQVFVGGIYIVYRTYVSFDTSALDDDALISSAVLQLKTESDNSATDFYVQIYGDSQPIWGASLETADWGCGTDFLTQWDSTNYVDETYVNFDISTEQINKAGRTQFEIISNRELDDTTPTGEEYVDFHSADSTGNEPKLVVTYTVEGPTGGVQQSIGENWKFAGEWHDFKITYTYGGELDIARMAFSDLYESYSLDFDGVNDQVAFTSKDRYLNNTWTVEFWGTSNNITHRSSVCGDVQGTHGYITIQDSAVGGTLSFEPSSVNGKGVGLGYGTFGPIFYNRGWTHVAIVMNSPDMTLYVNGSYVDSAQPADRITDLNVEYFGRGYTGAAGTYFDGQIDQFRIWNKSLTQSEIQYNMLYREPEDRLGLVGMWHMDEGAGTTVYDSSQYGVTGTISGATFTDGQITIDDHWVIAEYDITDDEWSLESGDEIAQIQTGEYEKTGNNYVVTYKIFFKTAILDKLDVDVYGWSINSTGNIFPWDVFAADYFNIYSLGGHVTLESNNVAGRIAGGDLFDLYADGANAWIMVNQTYRKIQHVKINAGFVIKDHSDVGDVYVRYGIDFVDPTTQLFIRGWNVLINVTAIDTSDASYCIIEVRWYYNDVQIGTTDTMYAMWETQAFATPDGEYDGVRFHLDLWFNKVNGSSVVGGRVSPYMYGLTKDDPAWWDWWGWFGTAQWKPLRVNATESFLFTNLEDYTGQTITAKALDLTRLWCNLTNVGANDDIYVMNYRTFDYSFAAGDMEGINTPPFPETLDPELPAGGGILAGLFTVVRELTGNIGRALSTGMLALWSSFVSFLDTVFGFAGWPNGFSMIMSWISSFLTWMLDGITYAISLLLSTFTLMASWLTFAIGRFTLLATGFIDIYNVLVSIWTQANDGWLSITSWLTPLLPLLPLALFIWIFSARDTEGLIGRVMMLWNLLSTTIGFLIQIGGFVFTLITGLIELVPVAE